MAILDWSLAGQLTADDRAQLSQVLVGGMALDAAREEQAGERNKALDSWMLVREQTAADADLRGWHLLAAKKVRELKSK